MHAHSRRRTGGTGERARRPSKKRHGKRDRLNQPFDYTDYPTPEIGQRSPDRFPDLRNR